MIEDLAAAPPYHRPIFETMARCPLHGVLWAHGVLAGCWVDDNCPEPQVIRPPGLGGSYHAEDL